MSNTGKIVVVLFVWLIVGFTIVQLTGIEPGSMAGWVLMQTPAGLLLAMIFLPIVGVIFGALVCAALKR